MITAGIDVGSKYTKAVVLKNGAEIVGYANIRTGMDHEKSAREALEEALKAAGINRDQVDKIIATGFGKTSVPFADDEISQVVAAGKGGYFARPSTRTVIEVGAEESRGIKLAEDGKIRDFALADKCAAGAGSFTDAMARYLEVPLEEFGQLSLRSKGAAAMNAQCVIFAESEVVSLVHQNVPKEEISRAIHDAIADRVASIVRRVGIEDDVLVVGGLANDPGFIDSLKRELNTEVYLPEIIAPEYIPALGAALMEE